MKNFIDSYLDIINEAVFKNKKWKFVENYKDIIIFENYKHLKNRLKIRYKLEFDIILEWNIFQRLIIDHLLSFSIWSKCSKKSPFQKSWTCYLTESNIWISGMIQNDLEDKV